MKKRIIKGCAWALALVTAVSLLALRQDTAYGAPGIDLENECSITFSLPKNGSLPSGTVDEKYSQYYTELDELLGKGQLKVDLYRVADVTVTGQYEVTGDFKDLGGTFTYKKADEGILLPGDKGYEKIEGEKESKGLAAVSSATSAEEWSALAKKAEALVKALEGEGTPGTQATSTGQISEGNMTISGLETGMYLICVREGRSALYDYSFVPFLISLPNNYYYSQPDGANGDNWMYATEVGLKPERKERYASLRITKTLDDFNATLGGALFVFDVTAVKDGEIVYSDVAQLDFDGPGNKSVLIGPEGKEGVDVVGKIPAGSTVTVTESYSGSAYEVVGDAVQTVSDISAVEEDNDDPSASVAFTNQYNGGLNGGAGVVNHFEYSEEIDNWLDPDQRFVSGQTEGGNPQ